MYFKNEDIKSRKVLSKAKTILKLNNGAVVFFEFYNTQDGVKRRRDIYIPAKYVDKMLEYLVSPN